MDNDWMNNGIEVPNDLLMEATKEIRLELTQEHEIDEKVKDNLNYLNNFRNTLKNFLNIN